jgi:DNA-directed RNA polymerase subunit M
MQFCPKCGSILIQKRKNYGCPNCNYTTKDKIKIESKEKFGEKQKVNVIKDKDVDVLPTVEAECSKCGHKEAHFWTSQTRSGDEAETKFFRCKKCRHTWREYK